MKEEQKSFVRMRAIEGKSITSISRELEQDEATLRQWDEKLSDEIQRAKAAEYDRIIEYFKLDKVSRIRYLAETYVRLQKELDKRDFSGLPTDKLYYILNDVYMLIEEEQQGPEE